MQSYSVEARLKATGADKFASAFQDASASIGNFKSAGKNIKGVGDSMTKKITKPAGIAAAAVGGLVTALGFKRLVGLDSAKAKLEGLGYSVEEVGTITDTVTDAIEGGMTTMAEGVDIAAGALAAGVKPGKDLAKYVELVGDAAVGANRPVDEMAQIFNRVQGGGRLMTQELNMIEQGMPGFAQAMADNLADGSLESFREMVTNGEVGSEEFLGVMDDFAGGMADSVSGSFAGMAKNALAYVGIIGESLLEGLFVDGKKGMEEFIEVLKSDEVMEWAERTGETIREVAQTIVGIVSDIKDVWDSLSPGIQDVIKKVVLFGGIALVALGPILKIVGTMMGLIPIIVAGLKILGAAIAFLTSPVGLVVAAIVAAAALIIAYWEPIKEFFLVMWESIKNAGIAIWEILQESWQVAVDLMMGIFEPIAEFFVDLWQKVSGVFTDAWDSLTSVLSEAWKGIEDAASAAWELIKTAILAPVLLLINLVTGDLESFKENLTQIWEKIKKSASDLWQGLKDAVMTVVNALVDGVKSLWEGLKNSASDIMTGIKNIASDIWGGIRDSVTNLAGKAKDGALEAWETIKTKTSEAFEAIVGFIKDPLESIDLLQIGKDIIQGLIDGIKSMGKWVKEQIDKLTGWIPNWIKDKLGISSPSKVTDKLGKFIGEGLADGISGSARMVEKASSALTDAAVIEPPSLAMGAGISGQVNDINKQAQRQMTNNVRSELNVGNQPANINVRIGNSEFNAFVDDISTNQNRKSFRARKNN